MTEPTADTTEQPEVTEFWAGRRAFYNGYGGPLTWHWLMYADGPLAGRTAAFGFYDPAEVPQHITPTVGIRHRPNHSVQDCETGEWRDVVAHPAEVVDRGRLASYRLVDGAYRYDGDVPWPEVEVEDPDDAEEADKA